MGDATVVSDGTANVVYVTLGGGDGNPANGAELVVATVSRDGGVTFGTTASDTVVVNGSPCGNGIQDLPDAAIDLTTSPPTIWVVWRHKGASSFGGCIAGGRVSNGGLSFDSPHSISNMDREDTASINMGQGGLRIAAGDGAVTVMYSNNDQLEKCPQPTHMAWKTVTSFDNGATWTDHALIFHTRKFASCVLKKTIANTLRAFDFVRAPDGTQYAAIADEEGSLRVFSNAHMGVKPDNSETSWREFCPTKPKPTPPSSDWNDIGVVCNDPAFMPLVGKTLLYPTLGADANGRLSLSYVESTKNEAELFPIYKGFTAPRGASVIVNSHVLDPNATLPVIVSDAGTPGFVTPYLAMGVGSPPIQSGRAPAARSCVADDPFFPFWLEPDGLVTRRVILTPP